MRNHRIRLLRACLFATALAAFCPVSARAGGGGENVAVVVNGDSWASLAVANEFIHLRNVPPRNVVYLPCPPDFERMNVEDFRKRILQPVLDAIEQRKLTGQIDYVVYSSDLPTEIDISADATKENIDKLPVQMRKTVTPVGSLSGLTFLHKLVLVRDIHYVSLVANHYFRPIAIRGGKPQVDGAVGFRSSYAWNPRGAIVPAEGGTQYLLSTMLAVTSGRGNSVREAIRCLQSAAAADGNGITGAIYYLRNNDVRSKSRDALFAPAAEALSALGVKAEVLEGVLPKNKKDVAGLMTGAPNFDWKGCGSTILPGAICENFTSWAGVMREAQGGDQTPLTDFIRYGAAGSCGTVTEPYSLWWKFPTAFMHVHYASGCTLAEAFYQSVASPYQLLVVGDPLCRPWAKVPRVAIECRTAGGAAVQAGGAVRGKLTIRAESEPNDMEIGRYELFVDGLRQADCAPGRTLEVDTDALPEGYHELRVVAVAKEPLQTQGRAILPVNVARGEPKLTVTPPKEKGVTWDQPLNLPAGLVGGKRILFLHNGREVGAVEGASGAAKIDLRTIGEGRVAIMPVGVIAANDGKETLVYGDPVELDVRPPMPMLPPAAPPDSATDKGVLVSPAEGRKVVVGKYTGDWLAAAGVRKDQDFQVQACFTVPDDDTYQFQLRTNMALTMELDSRPLDLSRQGVWRFIPVSLAKGTHRLLIKGKGVAGPYLDLRFGGPGACNFLHTFKHVRTPGEK